MLSTYEKRRKDRVKTLVEIGVVPLPPDAEDNAEPEAEGVQPLRATGADVSLSGMAFVCEQAFAAGTALCLKLELASGIASLRSTVVRSEQTAGNEQWKVAVKFEQLSDECLRLLAWFVKEEGRRQLLGPAPQHTIYAPLPTRSPAFDGSSASARPQPQPALATSLPHQLVRDPAISANAPLLEARWLGRSEERFVSEFLNRQPLRNVVMLGAVCDYGLESSLHGGSFYGCFRQEELIGVALIGRHVVLSGSKESVSVFAEVARHCHQSTLQMVLGEEELVEEFCRLLLQPPCQMTVRLAQPQILYAVTEIGNAVSEIKGLRLARTDEREEVAQVQARICREETGVDPLKLDPTGFRWRVTARIERGREWILCDANGIMFKTDVIFETEKAIYLEGVWVRPDLRGFGLGTTILKSLCQRLLRHHAAVCLFADGDDKRINAFYQGVGFKAMANYRVVRFGPGNEPS
jgi:GNAT superfamily N-acetyltransferase